MSTPAVSRDSFQDSKDYVEVVFQKNKDVLDSELNELQKIVRVRVIRGFRVAAGDNGGALANALHVESNATNNQCVVKAGVYLFCGYAIELLTDTTLSSGITTPSGADRRDTVWLKLEESYIDNSTDTTIAVQALGQTTQRRKLTITIGITQNSAVAPDDASGNMPWQGAVRATVLAHLYRLDGNAAITNAMIVDRRSRLGRVTEAQDRNTFITSTSTSWDGTTLTFTGLKIKAPGHSTNVFSGSVAKTPADGDAIGWSGVSGFLYRRQIQGSTDFDGSAESATRAPITTTALTGISTLNDQMFILALRVGSVIYLRDGTLLRSGDTLRGWGNPASWQNDAATDKAPLARWLDSAGKLHSLVDHLGLPGGRLTRFYEDWSPYALATTYTGGATTGSVLYTGSGWVAGYATEGSNAVTFPGADASMPAPTMKITGPAVGDDRSRWLTSLVPVVFMSDDIVVRAEFDIKVSDTSAASNHTEYYFGWTKRADFTDPQPAVGGAVNHGIVLHNTWDSTHWTAIGGTVGNGVFTVGPAVTTSWIRVRLEYHGKNTALPVEKGWTYFGLVAYIDDVKFAEMECNDPTVTAHALYWCYGVKYNGTPGAATYLQTGPLEIVATKYLSVPNL